MQLGEPGTDPDSVGLVGGVAGVGGDVFQFQDLGVLRGLDPGDAALRVASRASRSAAAVASLPQLPP